MSIELSEEFPVDWLAEVAAPVGSALELTTTAPVFTATILPSIDERETFPVVCRALVDAPVGKAEEETTTAPVLTAVTLEFNVERVDSVAAPVGSGKDEADTAKVPVPAFAVTVPVTGTGLPEPLLIVTAPERTIGLFGLIATTSAWSVATAAVEAAFIVNPVGIFVLIEDVSASTRRRVASVAIPPAPPAATIFTLSA